MNQTTSRASTNLTTSQLSVKFKEMLFATTSILTSSAREKCGECGRELFTTTSRFIRKRPTSIHQHALQVSCVASRSLLGTSSATLSSAHTATCQPRLPLRRTAGEQRRSSASMADREIYEPAFTGPPGTVLAGLPLTHLTLPTPYVSSGLPFQIACATHVRDTFKASRVYIVASRSLAANTDNVDKLVQAVGHDRVAGVRKGISPHSPISEILEIVKECKERRVDCLVTLGAGSITDGCKLVVFVSVGALASQPWSPC